MRSPLQDLPTGRLDKARCVIEISGGHQLEAEVVDVARRRERIGVQRDEVTATGRAEKCQISSDDESELCSEDAPIELFGLVDRDHGEMDVAKATSADRVRVQPSTHVRRR